MTATVTYSWSIFQYVAIVVHPHVCLYTNDTETPIDGITVHGAFKCIVGQMGEITVM